MKNAAFITVTMRSLSSGRKHFAMMFDSVDHAYAVSQILMQSSNYTRCYCAATDWQGNSLFEVRPPSYEPPPVAYPQMAPMGYAPQALPQPMPVSPQAAPRAFLDGQEIQCEVIPFPVLPPAR